MIKIIIFLVAFISSSMAYSKSMFVDTLKGSATVLFPNQHTAEPIFIGQQIPEDSSIVTKDRSFVKLKSDDGSIISLGSNSKIVVNAIFDRKKPTMLSLLMGSIRAKVSKQSQMDSKKEKFIVRSRQASLGVRGTEFQMSTSTDAKTTSVILIEGKVVFKKIVEEELIPAFDDAVTVNKGEFSSVNDEAIVATAPVKINEKQFDEIQSTDNVYEQTDTDTLKSNENYIDISKGEIVSIKPVIDNQVSKFNYRKDNKYKILLGYAFNTAYYENNGSQYKYGMDSFFMEVHPYSYKGFDIIMGIDFMKKPEILSIKNPSNAVAGDAVSSEINMMVGLDRNWFINSFGYGFSLEIGSKKLFQETNSKIGLKSKVFPTIAGLVSYSFSNLKVSFKPKVTITDSIGYGGQIKGTVLSNGIADYSIALEKNQYDSHNSDEKMMFILDLGF